MGGPLPDFVDPLRLAELHVRLAGPVALSSMPRLGTSLCSDKGQVFVELRFGVDDKGCHYVEGRIEAELHFACQRCMEPMAMTVKTDVNLALISSESEVDHVTGLHEPLIVPGTPMRLAQVIEDELILSLPMSPKHAPGACRTVVSNDPEDATPRTREGPFAALAGWRRKGHQ
ncbi:MAG: YceD family protein [Chromatiales bacterium]